MVVVVGRVGPYRIEYGLVHLALYLGEEVLITFKLLLFLIIQTVESNVLQPAAAVGRCEAVSYRSLCRNLTPLSVSPALRAVNGHTAFVEFLSVVEYILAHFT